MRCQALSPAKDLPSNAVEVVNILVSYLVHEHIDYAIEIGLQVMKRCYLLERNKQIRSVK